MGVEILDGKGRGRLVGVSEFRELLVHARVVTHLGFEALGGSKRTYTVSSGFVPLTSTGVFNGILYLKNTSEDLLLTVHRVHLAGDMIQKWKLIKMPTAGTLVSEANAANVENTNFQSSNVFAGDAYSAAGDGKTVTDGDDMDQWVANVGDLCEGTEGAVILGTNDSIAVVCKPSVAGDVAATLFIEQSSEPDL